MRLRRVSPGVVLCFSFLSVSASVFLYCNTTPSHRRHCEDFVSRFRKKNMFRSRTRSDRVGSGSSFVFGSPVHFRDRSPHFHWPPKGFLVPIFFTPQPIGNEVSRDSTRFSGSFFLLFFRTNFATFPWSVGETFFNFDAVALVSPIPGKSNDTLFTFFGPSEDTEPRWRRLVLFFFRVFSSNWARSMEGQARGGAMRRRSDTGPTADVDFSRRALFLLASSRSQIAVECRSRRVPAPDEPSPNSV